MAIHIRSHPTIETKVLGCLLALAAAGIATLYPTALLLAAFALGSLDEAIANNDGNLALQSLSVLIGITIVFGAALTGFSFGVTSCFKGIDRRLPKNATVMHRDVASAQFLHVPQSPIKRVIGMVEAVLAGMLLAASPVIVLAAPRPLIGSGLTQGLEDKTVLVVIVLVIVLFVALKRAAARRWASTVRMTARGMAVADPKSFSLPLPSSRNDLRIQEAPARLGRVTVQAVYAPPTGGAEPGRPIIIPRLSLTVRPSRLDDARSRVEARLDEVWRATQLIRASIEQEETADAPTAEPELKQAHRPPHQDADPDHDQSQADNPLP